nr:transposase family protein [Actinomyces sp. oral taxon 414]
MITPHKKPPNGELSEAAEEANKSISRIRQVVEQTIAHIKAWRIHPHRLPPPPAHIRTDHHRRTLTLRLQNHPLNNLQGRPGHPRLHRRLTPTGAVRPTGQGNCCRFWRSGRIVRVGISDALGGFRVIPRFWRRCGGVWGGTILPERHAPPRTRPTVRRGRFGPAAAGATGTAREPARPFRCPRASRGAARTAREPGMTGERTACPHRPGARLLDHSGCSTPSHSYQPRCSTSQASSP